MPDLRRDELLADRSLAGTVFCRAYSRHVDEWLQQIFAEQLGSRSGISLVAIGGYGRSTLSPSSDLDLLLLHDGWSESDLSNAAESIWFPIWDAHIDLGHGVRTVAQNIELANTDLDTATTLLHLRHLAGDADLTDDLAEASQRAWRRNARRFLPELVKGAAARAHECGEVAFLLEPDLKAASGGLRDIDVIGWIEAADIPVLPQERRELRAASEVLLAARVELHRSTGRSGDRLLLEEQDPVAEALGFDNADVMMSHIAASARTVTWIAEDVFLRVANHQRRFKRLRSDKPKRVDVAVELVHGAVSVDPDADLGGDETMVLRLAVAAAENDARIDRQSLDRLVNDGAELATPWTQEQRDLFVRLLATGQAAIPVIETLDHVGLWTRVLPRWEPTRSRVQRNQYHRFTVDRHLLEACAVAAGLAERVERPDLLLVGALLHDIGKGYPGDHTDVGVVLIDEIATEMGFCGDDVRTLKRLCEHHLLLPDAATRRDIEDVGTISAVADQVESPDFLWLLAALTEADSIATGPSAWSSWKAHLTHELSRSVEQWLHSPGSVRFERTFPDEAQRELLAGTDQIVFGEGDQLTVVTTDRLGLFARIAGALALRNLNIVHAMTHVEGDRALDVVRVVDPFHEDTPIEWPSTIALVEEVIATTDDLRDRFAERAASTMGRTVTAPVTIVPTKVDFDNEISAYATVVEVGGPDRLGLLHELATVIAAAGLTSLRAHIQTVGDDVVDSFYVRTLDGEKFTDAQAQQTLREALLAVLGDVPADR